MIQKMLATQFQLEFPEAGCDECGRGCLAGPVYAAAVILPPDFHHPLLRDSKRMTERDRYELRPIIEREAVSWAVGVVSVREIEEINILKASFLAMHRALDQLEPPAGFILVDGNRFTPYDLTPHRCIVKGDDKYANIAAASVLAKTYRDDRMCRLGEEFPQYSWNTNKGYPTLAHRAAIRSNGPTEHHRRTFRLLKED